MAKSLTWKQQVQLVAPINKRVKASLTEGLRAGGIEARIGLESVPGTKLWRVKVISPKFAKLRPSERQDLVWRILSDSLTREEQFQISMVLTLTPAEESGTWDD